MLRVTPIYGSSLSSANTNGACDDDDDPLEWLSSPVPSCTLVEYAGMKLLLNAGWDESLPPSGGGGSAAGEVGNNIAADTEKISNDSETTKQPTVPRELPDVDAVLICDSTLPSLGGLPLYFGAAKNSRRGRAPRSLSSSSSSTKKRHRRKRVRNPPFLATYPTVKMGQMTMYDHHASLSLDGCNPGYSLEDVDAVFGRESFRTLKYSQTVYLPLDDDDDEEDYYYSDGAEGDDIDENAMDIDKPISTKQQRLQNAKATTGSTSNKLLAITPHLSGHVVGGCYWVLKQLSDDTEIILAPTYHHAKERHLAGSSLHKFGLNADALLTMPGGPRGLLGRLYQPPPSPTQEAAATKYSRIIKYGKSRNKPILPPPLSHRSESQLLEYIMAALRRDGNVLLPTDASGRILELLLLLDKHWTAQRLSSAYNLCWVGPMSINTVEYARSQLEWMHPALGAMFDSQRGHPYQLKCVRICSSVDELDGVIERSNGNPTCVLASGATLDHGPARDLLVRWGGNPDNLICITDSTRCVPRGDVWFANRSSGSVHGRGGGVGGMMDNRSASKKEEMSRTAAVVTPTVIVAEDQADKKTDEEGLLGPALPPSQVSSYTTSSQLLYQWVLAKATSVEMADEITVDVYVPHRAPLGGDELRKFLTAEEEERRRKVREEEQRAMLREIELARGRLRLGDDGGGEGAATGGGASGGGKAATNAAGGSAAKKGPSGGGTAATATTAVARPKKKSRFDQNLFIKFSKPVHMTFPVREEAVGIGQPDSVAKYGIGESIGYRSGDILEDDYGIAVQADSFVDIVTGVDPLKFAGSKSGRIGEEVMKRGLGFGLDGSRAAMDPAGGDKSKGDGAMQDEDEEGINEKMLEVADLSSGKGIIKGRNGRPPIKVSVVPRKLEVLAEIVYVPLEGRVDARAARQSVRALQPRHLVVIGGPRVNCMLLTDALRSATASTSSSKKDGSGKKTGASVHIPRDGETVQLTVGHAAYAVRLIDAPYLTQSEREEIEREAAEKEGNEPPPVVEARPEVEAKIGDCTVSLVDYVATGKKWAVDGSIVLAPHRRRREDECGTLKQPSLMLSTREVLLTDLRAEVTALGMKAEYGALSGYSQLVVNGKIYVRKDNATGRLDVEGPLCDDFYAVRSVVCGQYVTI